MRSTPTFDNRTNFWWPSCDPHSHTAGGRVVGRRLCVTWRINKSRGAWNIYTVQSFVGRCCPCPLHLAIEVKILQNICMRNFSHNSKGGLFPLPPILCPCLSSFGSYFTISICTLVVVVVGGFVLRLRRRLCFHRWTRVASSRCLLLSGGVYWFSPLHEHFFDTYSTLDRVHGRGAERGTGRGGKGQWERHSNGNRTMCANTNFNARPKKRTKINCKAIAWRKSMINPIHTL